jgi:predicted PurR-regulated permease PerM
MLNGSVGDKGAPPFAMGRGVNRAMWTWKRLVRRLNRSDFVGSERVEAGLAKATFWKSHVASTARRLVIAGRKTDIGRALASAYDLLRANFGPKPHEVSGLTDPRVTDIDQDDQAEVLPMQGSETPLGSAGPKGEQVAMPLPSDFSDIFQGGLFLLAVLTALYVAREIVLPVVLAFVLKLLLQPAVRLLERARFPALLSAVLLISLLIGTVISFGTALSGPATTWAAKLPQGIPRLEEHLRFLNAPIEAVQNLGRQVEAYVGGNTPLASGAPPTPAVGTSLWAKLFSGMSVFVGGLFETVVVLFFLLMSGDTFLRRLVEILPRFRDKRQAIEISQQIEHDISAYLITITIMNAAVGFATAGVMWLCGVGDPILWGAVAFLLNYIPILGPMIGLLTFTLTGLLSISTLWGALLPAGLYLAIHVIEGETITPMLLARRFILNPVLVILALIFWYWMWGVPGAILAVPMLAIAKIICDRVQMLAALGHFLEG